VAREALTSDRGVYELVREKGWLTHEQLDEALSPRLLGLQLGPQPGARNGHHDVHDTAQPGVRCPTI
jgi:hypothetical protein